MIHLEKIEFFFANEIIQFRKKKGKLLLILKK